MLFWPRQIPEWRKAERKRLTFRKETKQTYFCLADFFFLYEYKKKRNNKIDVVITNKQKIIQKLFIEKKN